MYDVIVAGGGPAGIAAAVSAARNGSKVLLVEQAGFLGGMSTQGLVPAFCPFSDGKKKVIGGIGYEILSALKKELFNNPFWDEGNGLREMDWVSIDPEVLKRIFDRMMLENQVDLLLETTVTGTESTAGQIQAVKLYNIEGHRQIAASYFVDCTGNADLVAMSGGYCDLGDDNGAVQAATLCFRIGNIQTEQFLKYAAAEGEDGNLNIAVKKAREAGDFPFEQNNVAGFILQADGVAGLNFGHIYDLNPLNARKLTAAKLQARAAIPRMLDFLRKYVPGLQEAILIESASALGVRESRRIRGVYTLTREDYIQRRQFDDAVCRYSYPIDLHAARAEDIEYGGEREFVTSKYRDGESYTIPYRSLLPVGFQNLIVAGRIISAEREILSSVRVMPPCFATGEAAGCAAAIAKNMALALADIPTAQLQAQLRWQGVIL